MSRSTSQSSSATGTTASGLSRNLSLKTNTKPTLNTNPIPPSDIKLFVTNLRLLDLDLRSDWPNITVQTFSSRNADQKQRIGGVEWALFSLFDMWDPEETSQKLQPFFPPLEPLQSLNLRAALYRSLNELKKNGVLGRESVLRKTMLDECKGEKFFEVLASFSTAVLKKVLGARQGNKRRAAVARDLSTAPTLSNDRQASLLPLAIAHKAALVNLLRKKDEKRRKFAQFERVLTAKTDEIDQRLKQCKATPRARKPSISEKDAIAIKKQLKDNWIGNQKWLDTMLHGDDVQVEDAFLSRPFDHVWRMVEKGRRLEDAAPEVGLLENLQSRVQEQQTRLRKWKKFHEKMRKDEPKSSSSSDPRAQAPAKEFRFDDHLPLQIRSAKTSETELVQRPLHPEYRDIISEMETELSRVAKAKHNRSAVPQLQQRTSSLGDSRSPTRRRKSRSDSASSKPVSPVKTTRPVPPKRLDSKGRFPVRPQRHTPAATPVDSDATLVGHPSTTLRTAPLPSRSVEVVEETSDPLPTTSSAPHPVPALIHPRSSSPQPSSYFPSEPPILEPPTLTQEEAIAEQIISSIGDATPSPTKKQPRLSLLERTRMSMAHTNTFQPITESPAPDSPPLPEIVQPVPPLDRRASLLERTMLSMASRSANPRASLAPNPNKDKRKSGTRDSLFPVNQFDTPRTRKSISMIEGTRSGEHTPKEELFSDDVDYERIFKSRPKIATSPIFSPAFSSAPRDGGNDGDSEDFDEGVTGVDLGDVDADDDEDGFTQAWENSPLRRAGGGLKGKGKLFS